MSQSVVVFGAGRFGSSIAKELFKHDVEVMIVDKNYDLIQEIANQVTAAVQCDLADENAVDELGLANFDTAIVAIGSSLESSIISTIVAKNYQIPRVIAKATTVMQAKILEKLGADQIIFPEVEMGERLARSISDNNILEYIRFSDTYSLVEIKAKDKWVHKTLIELDFRNTYQLNVVAIRRNKQVFISELHTVRIESNDLLILIGETKAIEKFQN